MGYKFNLDSFSWSTLGLQLKHCLLTAELLSVLSILWFQAVSYHNTTTTNIRTDIQELNEISILPGCSDCRGHQGRSVKNLNKPLSRFFVEPRLWLKRKCDYTSRHWGVENTRMPLAREARIPAKRLALNRFLKTFNVIVIISGGLTVVMVICLQQPPKIFPGWLLIFLGGTTIAGGLSGYGGTTLPCCYITHLVTTCVSGFGNMVFSLCLFGQRPKVLDSFGKTRYTTESVDKFLISASWLFLAVTIIQICLIPARIILQNMTFETFETLEQTRNTRGHMMSQMRRDVSDHESKVDKTISNRLEERMTGKYGEWMKA